MRRSIVSIAITLLSASWLIAQPATAQGQRATPGVPDAATPKASVSDRELDQTAAAIQNVRKVRQDYSQKLSTASPADQEKIAKEANAALEKAVTDQGLSVDQYNSIVQLAQNDPNVRDRLVKRLGSPTK